MSVNIFFMKLLKLKFVTMDSNNIKHIHSSSSSVLFKVGDNGKENIVF